MRKKLVFLAFALTTAAGALLSSSRAEALPRCVTTCCDDGRCMTCCTYTHCSNLAC
jgi:hypothetical protein